MNKTEIKTHWYRNYQQSNSIKNNKQINYLPWILGGVGIMVVIIGAVWLVNRNKKEKH